MDRPTNWFDGEFPQISGATGHCGAARFGLALKTHEISEAGMADNQQHGSGAHGSMDISQHLKTYSGFWTGTKLVVSGCILLAIFLAIFRT